MYFCYYRYCYFVCYIYIYIFLLCCVFALVRSRTNGASAPIYISDLCVVLCNNVSIGFFDGDTCAFNDKLLPSVTGANVFVTKTRKSLVIIRLSFGSFVKKEICLFIIKKSVEVAIILLSLFPLFSGEKRIYRRRVRNFQS